jgi:hypothetical protein
VAKPTLASALFQTASANFWVTNTTASAATVPHDKSLFLNRLISQRLVVMEGNMTCVILFICSS